MFCPKCVDSISLKQIGHYYMITTILQKNIDYRKFRIPSEDWKFSLF